MADYLGSKDQNSDRGSVRRSQMTLFPTASSIIEVDGVSLGGIMETLRRTDVPGPVITTDCHRGALRLGAGAQFDVYGRRMHLMSTQKFDGPYLEQRQTEALPIDATTDDAEFTQRHVAIKRAYLSERRGYPQVVASKSSGGQTVEGTQLRNIVHEILSLLHPLVRQHPNIITLLGWGYDQDSESKSIFSPILIMEYATMSADQLSRQHRLPMGIKRHICAGMLAGVKVLHECGIVHSDVKPGNILIFAQQTSPFLCIAKVSDFGIAEQEVRDGHIDITTLPRGTKGWVAPEQEYAFLVPLEKVHVRDVWGCAMTVWSIFAHAGRLPPATRDHANEMRSDFEQLDLPPDLATRLGLLLYSCLAEDVTLRTHSVEDLRAVLGQAVWSDSSYEKETFRTIFTDKTDWEALHSESLSAAQHLYTDANTVQGSLKRKRDHKLSWEHRVERAADYVSRDDRLFNHLQTEARADKISPAEAFNIALAHGIDSQVVQEMEFLSRSARNGYLPAQAMFPHLAEMFSDKIRNQDRLDIAVSVSNYSDWQTNAVASGYLFTNASHITEEQMKEARHQFRRLGGYNTHYCGSTEGQRPESGLTGNVNADLHDWPLHLASAFDELMTPYGLSSTLTSGFDINMKDHWEDTALMKCCMAGHLSSLRALIQGDADASIRNPINGLTPLHWLFVFEADEVAEALSLLIAGGADPNKPNNAAGLQAFHFPFGWPSGSPLHYACFARNETAVKSLMQNGADMYLEDGAGQSSLVIAMKMLSVDLVAIMLQLQCGQPEPSSWQIVQEEYMEYEGEPDEELGDSGTTYPSPLHMFIWEPLFLGVNADLDGFETGEAGLPYDHDTAIFCGEDKEKKCIHILELFLQHYPGCLRWRTGNPERNITPLHLVMKNADIMPILVQYMISNGCPVDFNLFWVSLWRNQDAAPAIKMLLANVAEDTARRFVNRPAIRTSGSLAVAIFKSDVALTKVLLDYGADPHARFVDEEPSPFEIVREKVFGTDIADPSRFTSAFDERARAVYPTASYNNAIQAWTHAQTAMRDEAKQNRLEILHASTWCFDACLGLPGQVEPEQPPIEVNGQPEWVVGSILDSRLHYGRLQYRAAWEGHDPDSTWYNAAGFMNAPFKVKEFHEAYPAKPGPPLRLDAWLQAHQDDETLEETEEDSRAVNKTGSKRPRRRVNVGKDKCLLASELPSV